MLSAVRASSDRVAEGRKADGWGGTGETLLQPIGIDFRLLLPTPAAIRRPDELGDPPTHGVDHGVAGGPGRTAHGRSASRNGGVDPATSAIRGVPQRLPVTQGVARRGRIGEAAVHGWAGDGGNRTYCFHVLRRLPRLRLPRTSPIACREDRSIVPSGVADSHARARDGQECLANRGSAVRPRCAGCRARHTDGEEEDGHHNAEESLAHHSPFQSLVRGKRSGSIIRDTAICCLGQTSYRGVGLPSRVRPEVAT